MSESKGTLKRTLINGLLLFVVIAAGVFAGFWISVKTGLTHGLGPGQAYAAGTNKTNVKEGQVFPAIAGLDSSQQQVAVQPLLAGKKTILAFVSGTCDPCQQFAQEIAGWDQVNDGDFQVILLTHEPDMFRDNPHFTVLESSSELLDSLHVYMFPTIFAIDPKGVVRMASSGFGGNITPKLFADRFKHSS